MNFTNLTYLPFVLAGILVFAFLVFKTEKKYFQWVEDHWFFKRALSHKLASILYFAGFSLLLLALLDLRGPEKRVTGKVGKQKTIILIDSSASMLAEDVRPNRFQKASLLAKHFIKKAAGHQISVVVFSDGHKRIVPFTSDKDLVEARLDTLENIDLERGGTGLSLAIQESIQYFVNAENRPFGNILILTDAEQTGEGIGLDVPEGISVAVVGIGTAKGGPIPMRSSRGVFRGNKKYKGETVISRLDEKFLKSLGKEIEHFRYWIASSYTIPTEEILNFFNRSLKTKMGKEDFRIRPVLANYLLVPGVIALVAAFMLKNLKSFTLALVLFTFFEAKGQAPRKASSEKEPEKTPLILELEERFAKNELDDQGKKKLAAELLKAGFSEDSKNLYEEILSGDSAEPNYKERFNLGTAQFKSGDILGGMKTFDTLMDELEEKPGAGNKELLEKAKKNVLKAIQAQSQSNKKQKSDQKDQNQSDSQDQQGKSGESGEDSQEQKKGKGQKGEEENEEKNKGKKDEDKKKEGKEDEDSDQNKNKKNKGEAKPKGNKKKMPSILKQLMSDDNQLQKKVIDAETVKRKTRDKKDW